MAADQADDFIRHETQNLRDIAGRCSDGQVSGLLRAYASGLARGFKIARTGVPPAKDESLCNNLPALPAEGVQASTVETDLAGEP